MIIELNGNREGKPLCHVTMHGSKISGSQHNCVPANMAGIKKNWHVWLSFAWLHCHTGIKQNGNKTGQRNNTATKKWPDKPLWGTCAYRAVAVPEKGGRPPSFGRKPRPTWLRQTDTSLWQSFLNIPPPAPPFTSRSGSATAVIPLFPMKSRGEEWRHAHHHGSTISGWQQNQRRRRRKENGKKVKGFCWQNSKFRRASRYFVHFFPVAELLRPETS